MGPDDLLRRLREQRLTTLALADQIKDDRWREPALPGGRTIHDLLGHVLGWDEWMVAVLEISATRELPVFLGRSLAEVDSFNERSVTRYRGITRDDMLSALQSATPRVIQAATAIGGDEWYRRRIPDLVTAPADGEEAASRNQRGPSVGGILRILLEHEAEHAHELERAFQITPNLEQYGGPAADESGD